MSQWCLPSDLPSAITSPSFSLPPSLTPSLSPSPPTAPAAARELGGGRCLLLPLRALQLLHQGQAQPDSACALHEAPAQREPQETPALAEGPARGRGGPRLHLHHSQMPVFRHRSDLALCLHVLLTLPVCLRVFSPRHISSSPRHVVDGFFFCWSCCCPSGQWTNALGLRSTSNVGEILFLFFFFDYYVISESPEAHSCAPNKTLQQSSAATATAKVPINVLSAIKDVLRRGMKATSVGGARRQRQLRQQQEGQGSRRGNDDSSPAETKCLRRSFVRA